MPFFIAWIGSPLKYAVRCSNSVKSSTERRLRFEPWICWLNTPRRLVVSRRKRRCCGRMSGVRWNCPVVWPLTWQSRHVTPRLGSRVLRSSVGLNSSCGNGVSKQTEPVELDRRQDVLEQAVEVVDRDDLAARDVAELRPALEEDRRREFGQERLGQVEVHVEALQPREHRDLHCGNTCPPVACSGCGSAGYGNSLRLRISSGSPRRGGPS